MSTTTNVLAPAMAAIAAQLETELGPVVDGVQVVPRMIVNPTPPCIDIFPAPEGFLEQTNFGVGNQHGLLVVRATVSTADQEAGQDLLLDLLDPHGPTSVLQALMVDSSFGGAVDDSTVTAVTGFLSYTFDPAGGSLLGAEWRLDCLL